MVRIEGALMGALGALVGTVVIKLTQVDAEAGDIAVVIGVFALHRASSLALDLALVGTTTGDRAPWSHADGAQRHIVAGVLTISAADRAASLHAVAFEGAMIFAGMAALIGVVTFRIAAVAANSAAGSRSAGTIHEAIVTRAAQHAFP
jgi:hypothetical protein